MVTIKESDILKPETVFLILASIYGLLFLLITPPFQVPDEYQHFDYAYSVSTGKFFGYTSVIPRSINSLAEMTASLPSHPEAKISYLNIIKFINSPLNPKDNVPTNYQGAGKYNLVPYIPVAIGILIARSLNLNTLYFFYFGRIINLCVWILLVYHGIKFLPEFKWAFLLLILMPMSLFQAGSYSADVVTNSLAFLWICACIYYSSLKHQELSLKSRSFLIIIAALLSLTKPPYFFLLGLFFLIPRANFGSYRKYKRTVFLLCTISFLLLLFSFVYLIRNDMSISAGNESINFMSQMRFLFANPLNFPIVVLRSIKFLKIPYWYSSIGLLGWLDVVLPEYIYITYPIVVVFVCMIDHQKQGFFTLHQKLIFFLTAAAVLFTALLSVYLTWTPVGNKIIVGFQGRYLIPILPVLIPLFKNRFISISSKWKGILITVYLIIVLSITVKTLILRYYLV
jgi:uncharacterized membrane protein